VVFAGPFGTGKTEVAINYARAALRAGGKACLVDLDIVTPYFRVGDYREELASEGIQVIAAPGELASFEVPALPPEIAGALAAENLHVVADAGGDPVGARLLAVYAEQISARGYDMWMVVNPFRPAASTPEAVVREAAEMEELSGLRFTGLLANPNVGVLTDPHDILRGLEVAREAAARLALPVALAVERRLLAHLPSADLPLLPLDLIVRPPWAKPARQV
jgi:hypothetical protein